MPRLRPAAALGLPAVAARLWSMGFRIDEAIMKDPSFQRDYRLVLVTSDDR